METERIEVSAREREWLKVLQQVEGRDLWSGRWESNPRPAFRKLLKVLTVDPLVWAHLGAESRLLCPLRYAVNHR